MTGVGGVAHVTLLCAPAQLRDVKDFYSRVIGLESGARPAFDFPGAWMYAGNEPIIHLAAVLQDSAVAWVESSRSVMPGGGATGSVDHVALRATGTVAETRDKLQRFGVPYTEAPVPGFPLYQLFLNDPLGVKIELNFELAS